MGSRFVGGLLSCGVEVELAKATMEASKSYILQMQNQGNFLKSYADQALESSFSIQDAEKAQAAAEEQTGWGQITSGIIEGGGAIGNIAHRGYRETIGSSSLNQEGAHINGWKEAQEEGPAPVQIGAPPAAARSVDQTEINQLKSRIGGNQGPSEEDKNILKTLKPVDGQRVQDPNSPSRLSRKERTFRSKATREIKEKIEAAEKEHQNKQQAFQNITDRRSSYFTEFSRAGASAASGGFQLNAAKERKKQAEKDSLKSMQEFASQNFKGNSDMQSQAAGNSSQLISELTRARSEIAQANRM